MADIKSFNIFGASGSKNQGLEKIKQEAEAKKQATKISNTKPVPITEKKATTVKNSTTSNKKKYKRCWCSYQKF